MTNRYIVNFRGISLAGSFDTKKEAQDFLKTVKREAKITVEVD